MHKIAILLTCLTCLGNGQAAQSSAAGLEGSPHAGSQDPTNPLSSLAMLLLSSDPAAAFNLANPGTRSSIDRSAHTGLNRVGAVPVMEAFAVAEAAEDVDYLDPMTLEQKIEYYGLVHPSVLTAKLAMVDVMKEAGDLKGAGQMAREVAEARENVMGKYAPPTIAAKDKMLEILLAIGDEEAAEALKEEVAASKNLTYRQGRRGATYWGRINRKAGIQQRVRHLLDSSSLIFSVPCTGFVYKNFDDAKAKLPKGCDALAVKNTVMKRAIQDDPKWNAIVPSLYERSYWFFCDEDGVKPGVEGVQKWLKESGLAANKGIDIQFGCMEGALLDKKGVVAASKLPTRQELMQKIAVGINSIPTKLARGINQVPTKLARGIKQVPTKLGKGIALAADKGKEKSAATMGDI